jgi:hypothetical protein
VTLGLSSCVRPPCNQCWMVAASPTAMSSLGRRASAEGPLLLGRMLGVLGQAFEDVHGDFISHVLANPIS